MQEFEVEVVFTVEAEDAEDARTIVTESCQAGVEANVLPSYEIRERAVTELSDYRLRPEIVAAFRTWAAQRDAR